MRVCMCMRARICALVILPPIFHVTLSVAIVTDVLVFFLSYQSILTAMQGVKSGDEILVTHSLCHITQVVRDMKTALARMHGELCYR